MTVGCDVCHCVPTCSWLGQVPGHVLELCVVQCVKVSEIVSDSCALWVGMPRNAWLCVHMELYCVFGEERGSGVPPG